MTQIFVQREFHVTELIPFFIYVLPTFSFIVLLVIFVWLLTPGFRKLFVGRQNITPAILFQKWKDKPVSIIKGIFLAAFNLLAVYILHMISLYFSVVYIAFILKKIGLIKKLWPAALIGCILLAILPQSIYRISAFLGHHLLAADDIAQMPEQFPVEIGIDASWLSKEERDILYARWQHLLVSGVFKAVHIVQGQRSAVVSVKNGECTGPAAITANRTSRFRDPSAGIYMDDELNLNDQRQMLNFRYAGEIPFELSVSEQSFLQLYLDDKCLQVDADAPWQPSFQYVDTGTLATGFKSWPFDMDGWLRRAEIRQWSKTKKEWITVFRTTATTFLILNIGFLNIPSHTIEFCPDLPVAEKSTKSWTNGILPETAGKPIKYQYCPRNRFLFRMQKSGSFETPLLGSIKPVDIMEKKKERATEDLQQKMDNLLASKSWNSMTVQDQAFVEAYLGRRSWHISPPLTEKERETVRKIVANSGCVISKNNIVQLLREKYSMCQ